MIPATLRKSGMRESHFRRSLRPNVLGSVHLFRKERKREEEYKDSSTAPTAVHLVRVISTQNRLRFSLIRNFAHVLSELRAKIKAHQRTPIIRLPAAAPVVRLDCNQIVLIPSGSGGCRVLGRTLSPPRPPESRGGCNARTAGACAP
jgi:hypothetical protein